jgi:hypothetical protein
VQGCLHSRPAWFLYTADYSADWQAVRTDRMTVVFQGLYVMITPPRSCVRYSVRPT